MRTVLFAILGVAMSSVDAAEPASAVSRVDHLVFGSPDLQVGIESIERLLGVRATPGGQHPGRGTRNALVSLGPTSYLEIIGPDPEQPKPSDRRPWIDDLRAPRLVAWAAREADLERIVADAAKRGVTLGAIGSGSRKRPDGVVLSWRFTNPATVVADRIAPFFIDWGTSPHPAKTAAPGATLVALHAEHPDPERVRKTLLALGLHLEVAQGPAPALIATIECPNGRVELR